MYLLNDTDHQSLTLIASAIDAALSWPACDYAAALRAIQHDLSIVLKNTAKDEPIGVLAEGN